MGLGLRVGGHGAALYPIGSVPDRFRRCLGLTWGPQAPQSSPTVGLRYTRGDPAIKWVFPAHVPKCKAASSIPMGRFTASESSDMTKLDEKTIQRISRKLDSDYLRDNTDDMDSLVFGAVEYTEPD